MFKTRKEVKELKEKIEALESKVRQQCSYLLETYYYISNDLQYVDLKEVVEAMLHHFQLEIKKRPAKSESISLLKKQKVK